MDIAATIIAATPLLIEILKHVTAAEHSRELKNGDDKHRHVKDALNKEMPELTDDQIDEIIKCVVAGLNKTYKGRG